MADREPSGSPHAHHPKPGIETRRFHYFKYPKVGAKVLEAASPSPGDGQLVEDSFSSARQRIIERFPSDIEGLNMDRINSFMDSLGLRRPPVLVVDKEGYAKLSLKK